MSFFRPSLPVLLRQAENVLTTMSHAAKLPCVLWVDLDESPEQFAQRCARVGNRQILAAVPDGFVAPSNVQPVPFPVKLFELLHPSNPSRYRAASGHRVIDADQAHAHSVLPRDNAIVT